MGRVEDARKSAEVRYPWQLPLPPWSETSGLSEAERRGDEARSLFEIEEEARRWLPEAQEDLAFDDEGGYYRFAVGPKEGEFALSRERADWEGLKEIGYFEGWGL